MVCGVACARADRACTLGVCCMQASLACALGVPCCLACAADYSAKSNTSTQIFSVEVEVASFREQQRQPYA
ncbi:hypothetical protein COO60DRAFT_1486890 [Scenedesmus sp. NREL 46B-D3]|nr:hypothetical protein COO60DRAFT_1486890 [Scenedesmus sp. NREL 46B-D3]